MEKRTKIKLVDMGALNSKLLDLARKIHELAKRGVDGEKEAATTALERIMKKHGLTIEDIEGEEKATYWFSYTSADEKRLLHHTASSVASFETFLTKRNKTKTIGYKLTAAEGIELEMKYAILRKLLQDEYTIFYAAFVRKNHLYDVTAKARDWNDLTPEEKARQRRIDSMADSIKKAEIHKQLKTA